MYYGRCGNGECNLCGFNVIYCPRWVVYHAKSRFAQNGSASSIGRCDKMPANSICRCDKILCTVIGQ